MSQVTKPIALDETLQDVVTAIQGITQGGMIVSTGNVGSATQPVYINGGVPTAGMNFAITTGTSTSPDSNCSFDSGRADVKKSGNVVEVNVRLNVDTAFTPNENTQLFILPYKPVSNWVQLGRVSGAMNGTNVTGRVEVNSSSGGVIWGTAPYTQLTAGTKIWVTGTYLTND